jgi:hypothetical protein
MLTRHHHGLAFRTLQSWATHELLEAGATSECEVHGCMLDRADPHARDRALGMARADPPPGVSADEAVAAIEEVLESIGDRCPECPLEAARGGHHSRPCSDK